MRLFKDMDENQFWMALWSMAGLLVFSIIAFTGWTSMNEDILVHDLVEQGHDPIELACLYNSNSTPSCLIITQAKAQVYAKEANFSEDDITKIIKSATSK